MRLKNAIKLIFANFGATYKVLIYKLIVMAVLVAVGVFVLLPNFNQLIADSSLDKLFVAFGDIVKAIFQPSMDMSAAQQAFADSLTAFTTYIRENVWQIVGLAGVISLFYFVGMFFTNIANFSLGKMVNDYMSSLTKTGFTVGVFNSLGRASLYSLIELAVSLVFYVAVICLCFLSYGSYLPPYSRSSSPCWSW